MSKCITNRISLCSIVALSFLGVAANECLAQGSDCTNNGTFNVCVEWSLGDDPELTTDYDVTFHGAVDAPDLDLLKGNGRVAHVLLNVGDSNRTVADDQNSSFPG